MGLISLLISASQKPITRSFEYKFKLLSRLMKALGKLTGTTKTKN